jgi:hypothetical protein
MFSAFFCFYFILDVITFVIKALQKDIEMSTVEEALTRERAPITLNSLKLAEFLYGKKEYAELKRVLEENDVPPYDFNIFNRGRAEIVKQAIRNVPMQYKITRGDLTDTNMIYLLLGNMHQVPGSIHYGMFMKCIDILGTDKQRE